MVHTSFGQSGMTGYTGSSVADFPPQSDLWPLDGEYKIIQRHSQAYRSETVVGTS